ncbi:unnamed protein product [Prorocentrum cordatum]|uniref:Uncharacterized protein n=1 Tax=Prorocentrum cordatum TaxID=2364126 RepID=A0ABN9RHS3_9DINO|nr:unnamed protein product [Polarella glacialis]
MQVIQHVRRLLEQLVLAQGAVASSMRLGHVGVRGPGCPLEVGWRRSLERAAEFDWNHEYGCLVGCWSSGLEAGPTLKKACSRWKASAGQPEQAEDEDDEYEYEYKYEDEDESEYGARRRPMASPSKAAHFRAAISRSIFAAALSEATPAPAVFEAAISGAALVAGALEAAPLKVALGLAIFEAPLIRAALALAISRAAVAVAEVGSTETVGPEASEMSEVDLPSTLLDAEKLETCNAVNVEVAAEPPSATADIGEDLAVNEAADANAIGKEDSPWATDQSEEAARSSEKANPSDKRGALKKTGENVSRAETERRAEQGLAAEDTEDNGAPRDCPRAPTGGHPAGTGQDPPHTHPERNSPSTPGSPWCVAEDGNASSSPRGERRCWCLASAARASQGQAASRAASRRRDNGFEVRDGRSCRPAKDFAYDAEEAERLTEELERRRMGLEDHLLRRHSRSAVILAIPTPRDLPPPDSLRITPHSTPFATPRGLERQAGQVSRHRSSARGQLIASDRSDRKSDGHRSARPRSGGHRSGRSDHSGSRSGGAVPLECEGLDEMTALVRDMFTPQCSPEPTKVSRRRPSSRGMTPSSADVSASSSARRVHRQRAPEAAPPLRGAHASARQASFARGGRGWGVPDGEPQEAADVEFCQLLQSALANGKHGRLGSLGSVSRPHAQDGPPAPVAWAGPAGARAAGEPSVQAAGGARSPEGAAGRAAPAAHGRGRSRRSSRDAEGALGTCGRCFVFPF